MAQKAVNIKQAFGVEGEFYDSSIKAVTTYIAATTVKVGNPVYFDANGKVAATGTKFAGIVVNPKEYTQTTIGSTLDLAAGTPVAVASKGHIIVKAAGAIAVGASLGYDSGWKTVESGGLGKAVITAAAANELAVIEL